MVSMVLERRGFKESQSVGSLLMIRRGEDGDKERVREKTGLVSCSALSMWIPPSTAVRRGFSMH